MTLKACFPTIYFTYSQVVIKSKKGRGRKKKNIVHCLKGGNMRVAESKQGVFSR